ncbi:LysR family transcriptional regulator [Caproiciproducens sp. NJN-50]|uniref:LysR family transcriptional regulator n=1 Tax=Caproiciproducens sp. NJN-50 TaxID=2507162 RepID=UPI000FFE0F46|nr:LysR family transcriptional regulator [Caproiciproducens sp. NJN-50]QAT48795.1 LysR family transcriptional regulator [Caproiciproducens sp. NJN-50]
MDIRNANYFAAIAEEKSISKAAERLFISQPALSQQLSKLEDELHTKLFIRKKDTLELTEAGRIYLNCVYNIQYIEKQAMNKILEIRNEKKPCVK